MLLKISMLCAAPALFVLAARGQDTVKLPDDAAGTVRAVVSGIAANHPDILWQALPPSYQDDIHSLIHEFGEKVDAKTYDKFFALMQKAVHVLDTKRDFFLGSEMASGVVDRDEAKRNWSALVKMCDTLATSELSSAASLQSLDVGKLLHGTGRDFMAQMTSAAEMAKGDPFAKLREFEVEEIEADADTATLSLTAPGKSEEVEFQRVEGRWVPVEMAEDWDDEMRKAHKKIDEMPIGKDNKKQAEIRMALSMAEGFLDQLAEVESQEEFDQSIGMLFGGLMGSARPGR